jgi:ABC-type multidrug transport system fused ATPase/permease subunit
LSDYETDALIQKALRKTISADTTIITIAHRLQTIMDADKIVRPNYIGFCFILSTDPGLQLVLDAGRIVEFDTPKALLDKEQGRFKALVNSSLDKEALYAMVGVRT